MGIAIDHKMGIAIDPKMRIATSKFSHWRAWPFNVILHLCILPKCETRNVADVAPSPVDNMRNNSHIKTHNQVRKATSSSSKEFRYRVCLSDLSLHRLHALLLLHGQVLGMGSFATRIWHWFGLLEKVWLANWVQVWRGSTLNGLVVPLGQNKQEELVPVCPHFIHKWWKVAEPCEHLFADRSIDLLDALLKFFSVALGCPTKTHVLKLWEYICTDTKMQTRSGDCKGKRGSDHAREIHPQCRSRSGSSSPWMSQKVWRRMLCHIRCNRVWDRAKELSRLSGTPHHCFRARAWPVG